MATRRELINAIADRYRSANPIEKKKRLDEFIEVTGFHRKHAIRAGAGQRQSEDDPPDAKKNE